MTKRIDLRRGALFALIFALAALPVLAAPIIPAIDYYSHVARYFVLSQLPGDAFLSQHYEARWAVLPNIGLDVVGTALLRVVPPLVGAKAIVLLVMAVQYFGVLAFSRQLNGRASLLTALLLAPLLYSFILGWGFSNFLLGLGLVFWGAAWWLANRTRLWLATPVACAIAIIIFLTHGVAFALYGLLLGALELGFFMRSADRSPAALARRMAALAVQALAPVALFLASPTSRSEDGLTNADEAIRKLAQDGGLAARLQELVTYRLATIVRVSESSSAALDLVTFVAVAGALAVLAHRRRLVLAPVAVVALALAALLVVIVPPAMFGVGYVSDRMPLFLALVLVGALAWRAERPSRLELACLAVVIGCVAVRLVWIGFDWQSYRDDVSSFRSAARTIPAHSLVAYVNAANGKRLEPGRRCQMFGPLLIPLYGQATTIFAFQSQQPIALRGRLSRATQAAASRGDKGPESSDGAAKLAALAEDGLFDYALVCGTTQRGTPSSGAELITRQGRFALYGLTN